MYREQKTFSESGPEEFSEGDLNHLIANELKRICLGQKEMIHSLEIASRDATTEGLKSILNRQLTVARHQLQKIERASYFFDLALGERKALLWNII
jgi:hypothetical protein